MRLLFHASREDTRDLDRSGRLLQLKPGRLLQLKPALHFGNANVGLVS